MVIDSGQYIPHKHRSMLLNLFDLESITVEDVMTPRGAIEEHRPVRPGATSSATRSPPASTPASRSTTATAST